MKAIEQEGVDRGAVLPSGCKAGFGKARDQSHRLRIERMLVRETDNIWDLGMLNEGRGERCLTDEKRSRKCRETG